MKKKKKKPQHTQRDPTQSTTILAAIFIDLDCHVTGNETYLAMNSKCIKGKQWWYMANGVNMLPIASRDLITIFSIFSV